MTKKARHGEPGAEETAAPEAPAASPAAAANPPAVPADAPPPPDEEPLRMQLLRLQADFDNYRKRMARERVEIGARAQEMLLHELLPALDHYRLGLAHARQTPDATPVVAGFELVWEQLWSALQRFGLSAVDTAGVPFDPHAHEAVRQTASADRPEGEVLEVTRTGYRLGERLLRPAQVVVSSGPPETGAPPPEGD